jgi:hypothetical protein
MLCDVMVRSLVEEGDLRIALLCAGSRLMGYEGGFRGWLVTAG